jgi:hypothetical protein
MSRRVISRDPDVMGGTPVFRGTRVPIRTLLLPSITRDQVVSFLEQAADQFVQSIG